MTDDEAQEGALCFVDGPLRLYITEAPTQEIIAAFERVKRYIPIAALQLGERYDNRHDTVG